MKNRVLLFVDDDPDVREAFADLFVFSGWQVVHAENGREALDWLGTHESPAAILLDLKMPILDGYAFRQRQLADARLRQIPTLVFTADATADALPLGMVVARKSLDFDVLLRMVEAAAR